MCGTLHFSQCLKHGLLCILLGWVTGVLIRIRCFSLEGIGSVYEICMCIRRCKGCSTILATFLAIWLSSELLLATTSVYTTASIFISNGEKIVSYNTFYTFLENCLT